MPKALEWAASIIANSPDAVWSTKRALVLAKEYGVEQSMQMHALGEESRRMFRSENIKEGLKAFVEVR